ncbi:MAG: LEA type 2 family protein [Planctomycetota bacterium]
MAVAMTAAIVVAVGAGGCGYAPPKFTVLDAAIVEETAQGFVIEFEVEGENPNDEPLILEAVEYSLSLDGRRRFGGVRSPEVTLPANGSQRMRLPAAIGLGERETLPSGIREYRMVGTVIYEVPGSIAELLFDSNIRRPRQPFSRNGELDFGDPPGPVMPDDMLPAESPASE